MKADEREIAPNGTATVGGDPALFVFKNLHIIGTMVGSMRDTDAALGFAARVSSKLPVRSIALSTNAHSGAVETDIREIPNQQTSRSCPEAEGRKSSGKMRCGLQLLSGIELDLLMATSCTVAE
jgi:hypothetical protein